MLTAYQKLSSQEELTRSLGKMVLAFGHLESVLLTYLESKDVPASSKTPLGGLVKKMQANRIVDETAAFHLRFLMDQRNYFVHRVSALMNGHEIDQRDVDTFRNRIDGLTDEAEFFASGFSEVRS
ncbi:hypothetical protein [Salinisphaera sp. T31B1]|uniref:hypothetical protein n=1 Tax=Salinisphaera sp. T31B1 TaxID=727963 RepID=UPI00334289BF